MKILVWVLQVLLAIAFLAHGWLLLSPPAAIAEQLNATLPRWFQLFLGVAEVLAAVGLTLPPVTGILPGLAVWASVGIMIVMVSATVFHLSRGEISSAATTLVLLGIATFVAYMRYRVLPIPPRGTNAHHVLKNAHGQEALPMNRFLAGAVLTLASMTTPAQGTTRFVFDGNRIYAELGFLRPDGSTHRALAFVDMGSPEMVLRESLFKELKLEDGRPLAFNVGALRIERPAAQVISEPRAPSSIGSDLKVEGILPASVLKNYLVVIDYGRRTLTLGRPSASKPEGVAVPFRMNDRTGLISIDVSVDGTSYPITIDNGSAYTWVRQSTGKTWLAAHPNWEHGVGAVGASNMMMSGDRSETAGIMMRIPRIAVGSLALSNAGALAAGPGTVDGQDLFDWYSQKNSGAVIGWIGGNILKAFQITIDYPNRIMYWLKQRDLEANDLDQVGLTLRSDHGAFFVAGIATKNGKPAVDGIMPGDKLVRVAGLETATATWGALFAALHGQPGALRTLTIDRNGQTLVVRAPVTAF